MAKELPVSRAERELAWMNGEYAKLKEKYDALEAETRGYAARIEKVEADARTLEKEVKAVEDRSKHHAENMKIEKEFRAEVEKARDDWKKFSVALALQIHAIEGVMEGNTSEEAIAARQLVQAAKKVPHPAADPMHPDVWKWFLLGGVGVMAYMLYSGLGVYASKAGKTGASSSCPPAGTP